MPGGWKYWRRNLHRPRETDRELALRLGDTPPEFRTGEDHMESRILRAKRSRALKRAYRKGRNPYAVEYQFEEGEFWPYGAERRHGVYGWGEVIDGHYHPYDNHNYVFQLEMDVWRDIVAEAEETAYEMGWDSRDYFEQFYSEMCEVFRWRISGGHPHQGPQLPYW